MEDIRSYGQDDCYSINEFLTFAIYAKSTKNIFSMA